jgi:DNA-binding NtrC family response regulator
MSRKLEPAAPLETTILIVDDLPANRDLLRQTLEPMGCEVLLAADGEAALKVAARGQPDLILLDVMMPGLNGYETCRRLKSVEATQRIPVIFITAQDDAKDVVEGFRAGGVDYIIKPFRMEEVLARVETHLKISRLTRALERKNAELEAEMARRETAEDALATADSQLSLLSAREAERWGVGMLGQSGSFAKIIEDIRKAHQAGTISVLITGESGTGKELIARAIHAGGARAKGPFIPVNCSAIPRDLAESLFFGHVKGAFSGAHSDQKGYFELAHGGTLFLDEVGEMPAALQPKLLRVLEDGRVTPLGATKEKQVEVRVVAASNVDFPKRIAAGEFRQDLYYRLARFTVVAPPLRERREDIPLLAAHFAKLFATEMGKATPVISDEALAALRAHPLAGNVRELKNLIEAALIESGGGPVRPEHLRLLTFAPPAPLPAGSAAASDDDELPLNLEQAERALMRKALARSGGNVSKAAELLGVNRTRIYRVLGGGEGA